MGWLILSALVMIIIVLVAILKNLQILNSNLGKNIENQNTIYQQIIGLQAKVKQKSSVTDPFVAANKTHVPGASSKHIIVRKTPDQIRAENYEEIKKGATYGQAE